MAWFDWFSRKRGWIAGAILAGLAACASPPLPPPAAPRPAPVQAVPEPARPAPPAPAPAAPPPTLAVPYNAAVAARFPDPSLSYRTPAFEPGHAGFTSNAELHAVLQGLARPGGAAGGSRVLLLALGNSQAGVPLEALLFTRNADTEPDALRRAGRPTVLLIGQQHGNEPAASEALIVIAQELAQGSLQALLEHINVVILPRANPDGAHSNQRATANGIDANRDHLLLKTPEVQVQARLVRDYRPVVVVDAHEYAVAGPMQEKFGAVQRFDAMLQYAMTANYPEFLGRASEEWFRVPMLASLKREGLTSEWYHTSSDDVNDKRVAMGGTEPDTSRNVNGLTNAISFLIETRGAGIGRAHLKRRVHTHVTAIGSVLKQAAAHADALMKLRQFVDNDVSAQACQGEAIVDAASTPSEYSLLMLDPVSGADKPVTVTWDSALELRMLKMRARPCGYWLAADQTDAVQRLRGLGVLVQQLAETGVMRGETYRETAPGDAAAAPQVQTVPALIDVGAGSYYVPLDQPLANLALAALEPDTRHSYAANGIVGVAGEARVMSRPEMKMVLVP